MLRKSIRDFFDNKLKKAPQSSLVKALKNEFDIIKSNHENEVSFMTQALRDFDMRHQGRIEERSDIMNKQLSQGFLSKERIEQFNRQNTFQPENVPANQTEN